MKPVDRQHILIVEDSEDLQFLLFQLLKSEGFELSKAFNGREALDLLRTMPELPHLILLDLMMPVMSGIEFLREQVKDPRLASIPVVVFTADANPHAKLRELAVREILRKPVSVDELLEVTHRYARAGN
jgi:CheY-like chemotaxis protein